MRVRREQARVGVRPRTRVHGAAGKLAGMYRWGWAQRTRDAAPQHGLGFDSSPVKTAFPVKHAPLLNFATPLSAVTHSELLGISQLSLVPKLKNQKNRSFVAAKPPRSVAARGPAALLSASDEHRSASSGPSRRVRGTRRCRAPRGRARAARGRAGAGAPARLPSPPGQGRSCSRCEIPGGDVTPSPSRGSAARRSGQADAPSAGSRVRDHKGMSKYFPFQIFKQQPAEPSAYGWRVFPLRIQHLSQSCPRSSGARPPRFSESCNTGTLRRDDKAEQEPK